MSRVGNVDAVAIPGRTSPLADTPSHSPQSVVNLTGVHVDAQSVDQVQPRRAGGDPIRIWGGSQGRDVARE